MSLLEQEGGPERLGEEMRSALEGTGFFFLENHGVPSELIEGAYNLAERIHALPLEEKLQFKREPYGTGYLPLGQHTRPAFYSKPSGNAAFFLRFPDNEAAHNQWPEEESERGVGLGWRKLAIAYADATGRLAWELLGLIARALKLHPDFFEEPFRGAQTSLRLSHYPESAGFELSGKNNMRMGIAAHTDSGILTLLAQSDKPGLELCLPDGRWVRPQSMPGTFLVNSGDLLRRWTNHRFLSSLHRVVNLPNQERYAVPFFLMGPRADFPMQTLPGCADPQENPDRYNDAINLTEFMKGWRAGEDKHIKTLTPAQVKAAYEGTVEDPDQDDKAASKL